jgi:hypothetical protein
LLLKFVLLAVPVLSPLFHDGGSPPRIRFMPVLVSTIY